MGNSRFEVIVGLFLMIGFLALGWLALQLGEIPWLVGSKNYMLAAEFNNISGVKTGADVQIAGVAVGKVRQLSLNKQNQAVVSMQIERG